MVAVVPPFYWGSSTWGTSTGWTSPGVYSETTPVISSDSSTSTVEPVVIASTSGKASAVSDSYAGSSATAFVDPTGTGLFVSTTTARLYQRIPACYRDADAVIVAPTSLIATTLDSTAPFDGGSAGAGTATQDFPLLRWLSCLVDQAGQIEAIIDANITPGTASLTDPATAPPAWLPWLGQLVGLNLANPVGDIPAARTLIANAFAGSPAGSKPSIAAAVANVLTGTKQVTVTEHYQGNPWEIQVATLASETPTSLPGQAGFVWGQSAWSTTSATWAPPGAIAWLLGHLRLVPAGFTIVNTTS